MYSYEWHSHTGLCPMKNTQSTIFIKYAVIEPNVYKKLEDNCTDKFTCGFLDKYERCPLYISAPETPRNS